MSWLCIDCEVLEEVETAQDGGLLFIRRRQRKNEDSPRNREEAKNGQAEFQQRIETFTFRYVLSRFLIETKPNVLALEMNTHILKENTSKPLQFQLSAAKEYISYFHLT